MKLFFVSIFQLVFFIESVFGQGSPPASGDTTLIAYTGNYGQKDDSAIFQIILRDKQLFFGTEHYGKIAMLPQPDGRFKLQGVFPYAFLSFIRDFSGKIVRIRLDQKGTFTWLKMKDTARVSPAGRPQGPLNEYAGAYRQDIDPFKFIHLSDSNGQLHSDELLLSPVGRDQFRWQDSVLSYTYDFTRDRKNQVKKVVVTQEGPQFFQKIFPGGNGLVEHFSSRQNGFTRADSLHGMLTPARTCYDVLFYGFDVTIEPETQSVRGNVLIRYRVVHPFDSLQVDLFDNMTIGKILFHGQELSYRREYNAVFIHWPATVAEGGVDEIRIFYSGKPQHPDMDMLAGGFFWVHDREGRPWIESVCQGAGASLWWPCKDHLSDKPDSMSISITAPSDMTEISNGRLLRKTDLPDHQTRYDWYVSYPINTYNVAVTIGYYVHFSDRYVSGKDTIPINYYCMPYNLEIARKIFKDVPRMLALYEKDFGPYPFARDGYTLMESFYPMEHQSAVEIGYFNQPFNTEKFDSMELKRIMWHETGHEWWGNSVTCKDYADFWIHEAFATYAELLNYEAAGGKDAANANLRSLRPQPENREPIIGVYNVNHFHMGDMYPKGCQMLQTLRRLIGNDSMWFAALKGIQQRYRYQAVTTEDIVSYFNQALGADYTYLFDQYLRYPHIPVLALAFHTDGGRLSVDYKWVADVTGFHMPVKVTVAKDSLAFIYPTMSWQTMEMAGMVSADFHVDTDDFYVGVKVE
jgi:hypothetical protein